MLDADKGIHAGKTGILSYTFKPQINGDAARLGEQRYTIDTSAAVDVIVATTADQQVVAVSAIEYVLPAKAAERVMTLAAAQGIAAAGANEGVVASGAAARDPDRDELPLTNRLRPVGHIEVKILDVLNGVGAKSGHNANTCHSCGSVLRNRHFKHVLERAV